MRTLAKSVGYVMGAGDEMPQALEQMGCAVTLLADDELERGDRSNLLYFLLMCRLIFVPWVAFRVGTPYEEG